MLTFVDTPLAIRPALPPAPGDTGPFALTDALVPGSEAARRLLEPGAVAVTTGQQPGLFLGPLYTLHKALSARALARACEAAWGRPVVPVFWIAADDHDFAEGASTSWLGVDGAEVHAALPSRPDDAPLVPMYREPVPGAVDALLQQLEATSPPGAERDATLAWLRRHYRSGHALARAFGGALAELLAPLGIVCIDGSHGALKRAAWPVMRAALEQAETLDSALAARHEHLAGAGIDPGVKVGDGATLVMLEGRLGRDRLLRADGGGFVARRSGERFSLTELDQIAESDPARLSANVLLRPVIERATVPTVAYVAGPGELRYLELAAALYGPLGVPRQAPTPRWSGMLVEPRITRTLDKLGLTIDDVRTEGPALEQRLARQLAPPGFEPAVDAARGAIEEAYQALTGEIRAIDPTLEKPARSTMAHAINGLADLEKRVLQAIKRKQAEALAQLERVQAALQPQGAPQERILGPAGFLARYGNGWLHDLAEHVDGWYQRALEAPTASP